MQVELALTRPLRAIRSARISAHHDLVRSVTWMVALGLAATAALLRGGLIFPAAATTWPAFLTLAVVIGGGLALDALGVFRLLARLVIPSDAPDWLVAAGALGLTALLSGVVNLDVAVVVAVPIALAVARERGLAAGRLAVAAALTANATSFLLPTSNLTTLLVLDHAPLGAWPYLRDSWLAWLLVTALTVGTLTVLMHIGHRSSTVRTRKGEAGGTDPARLSSPRSSERPERGRAGVEQAILALLDLVPMFIAAASIRALLDGGMTLGGGLLAQLGMASGLAAGANNLPAAAAVVASGRLSMWAAVLGLAIGPNLLMTGSVASLITRRIARDRGAGFGVVAFSLTGATMLPFQLIVALIGLRLVGAL